MSKQGIHYKALCIAGLSLSHSFQLKQFDSQLRYTHTRFRLGNNTYVTMDD